MSILKTLMVNGVTYKVAPMVPADTVTLYASAWEGGEHCYSQVVNINGVTAKTKVDLQPTSEQLAEFHYKILAFVAENDGGIVTVYSIGDRPTGDHTIQITKTEVDGSGKIKGNTVGTTMPAVLYTEQNLSEEQKAVARKNIGMDTLPDVDTSGVRVFTQFTGDPEPGNAKKGDVLFVIEEDVPDRPHKGEETKPPYTAEEIACDVEVNGEQQTNVADALSALALSGGGDGWELLKEITLEEDTQIATVSFDKGYNEIRIRFENLWNAGAEAAGSIGFAVGVNGNAPGVGTGGTGLGAFIMKEPYNAMGVAYIQRLSNSFALVAISGTHNTGNRNGSGLSAIRGDNLLQGGISNIKFSLGSYGKNIMNTGAIFYIEGR